MLTGDPATPPPASGTGFDLSEIPGVLLKRVWVLLFVFLVTLAGGLYLVQQRAVVYRASTQILINSEQQQILGEVRPVGDQVGSSYWAMRDFMRTQQRILSSRDLSLQVAERLGLESDLVFLGVSGIEDPAARAAALTTIDVASRVRASLSVEQVPDSQILNVTVVSPSATASRDVANSLADVYVERNLERRVQSIANAADWLADQQASLGSELATAERAMVNYRQENQILAVELENNLSLLAEMQAVSNQLSEARLEVDRLRTTVVYIERVLSSGDLMDARLDAVVSNVLVQNLKARYVELEVQRLGLATRYLDGHPDLRSLVDQQSAVQQTLVREIQTVLRSFTDRYETAVDLERRLSARLADVERRAQALGEHAVEYNVLERNAEANRELFRMIERRLKEVEITRNSQHNNVEVLERAVLPSAPYDPQRQTFLLMAALLALLLAAGAVFALEMLDNTVKSREYLEKRFGVAFLGMIPVIRTNPSGKRSTRGPGRGEVYNSDLFVHDFPRSNVAECCRSIRTNLLFLGSDKPLDRLLVTSAGPREGKTTTTCNIGIAMAQSGARVLLVDTDMRRPRLHKAFRTGHEVGLSTLLLNEATPEQAIQTTPVPNLFLLPSGPIPPNPTELMHTERFQEVLADLSSRFDRVIFDSPPVSPVTDAVVLSGFVDGVVLVVKSGGTRKDVLARSIESLRSVRANLLGAVLNHVDLSKRQGGYYYNYYYRRSDSYYGPTDDEETSTQP